jgi:2-oxoisovalerate dehydrogenase E1 component
MKGLMKAAFLDPNPVVMLEHKGIYWSKVPGTEEAKTIEPSKDYILPLGKGRYCFESPGFEDCYRGKPVALLPMVWVFIGQKRRQRNFRDKLR